MPTLIQLLNYKLYLLERILSLNELQLKLLSIGHTSTLKDFFFKRKEILKILEYVDSQIIKALSKVTQDEFNTKDIQNYQKIKKQYSNRILATEMQIFTWLDGWNNAYQQFQSKDFKPYYYKVSFS